MADIYNAADLREALKLAKEFKLAGKYNLFRGQAKNWPVKSTAGRLSKQSHEKARQALERLYYYFTTNSALSKYKDNIDWFYAVAQHYGIPTNYIDFTTDPEVATFFATNSKSNVEGENCVIICLNETDFIEFVEFTKLLYEKDNVIPPQIVKVDVDNLWRLQAQSGHFLFTPYGSIEHYYDFDRIIFPFVEPFNQIKSEHIYPKTKSELEILLDHFFNTEKRIEGQRNMQKLIKAVKIPVYEFPSENIGTYLKNKKRHRTWSKANIKSWEFLTNELWQKNAIAAKISLKVNANKEPSEQIEEISRYVFSELESNNDITRDNNLDFDIVFTPKSTKKNHRIINSNCKRIWDGTRNLPYSLNDIASILSKYICLEYHKQKFDKIISFSGEKLITLELTNEYGSITRCMASPSVIVNAFRKDLKSVLIDELITDPISSRVLLYVNRPNLVFNFNLLAKAFVKELIAYQVLHNSRDEKPVIFYTPSQLTILGYA